MEETTRPMAKSELTTRSLRSKYSSCDLGKSSGSSVSTSSDSGIGPQYVLKRWCLKPATDGKICLCGCVDDAGTVWKNVTVDSRIDAWTVKTLSGSVYRLDGPLDKEMSLKHGVPSLIVQALYRGFPRRWKVVLSTKNESCKTENLETDSISEAAGTNNHSMITRSKSVQSFSVHPSTQTKTEPLVGHARKRSPQKQNIVCKSLRIVVADIAKTSRYDCKVDSKRETTGTSVNKHDKHLRDIVSNMPRCNKAKASCRVAGDIGNPEASRDGRSVSKLKQKATPRGVRPKLRLKARKPTSIGSKGIPILGLSNRSLPVPVSKPKSCRKRTTKDAVPEKTALATKENVAIVPLASSPVRITAGKGTMKRKRQIKELLLHINKGHEDDMFDVTPYRKKQRKFVDLDSSTMLLMSPADFKTPIYPRWHPAAQPTPMSEVVFNTKTNETYVHNFHKWRKENAKKERTLNITPIAPPKPKLKVTDDQFLSLMRSKTPANDEDQEEEEDYYFTDTSS